MLFWKLKKSAGSGAFQIILIYRHNTLMDGNLLMKTNKMYIICTSDLARSDLNREFSNINHGNQVSLK